MTVATESYPFDTSQATEARWGTLSSCFPYASGVLNRGNGLNTIGDSTGMQVKVASGEAWCGGGYGRFDTNPMALTIGSSAGIASGYRRIDRVVVRTDWAANLVEVVVKPGTIDTIAAAVPPVLVQSMSTVWEQSLAQVWVGNGTATITAAMVIDERTFARCPTGIKPGQYVWTTNNSAPAGALPPDGRAVSRITYAEYFAVVGTLFGAGDGLTTFNIPDKRGEVLANPDDNGGSAASRLAIYSLTAHPGEQTHTPTVAEMVAHSHGPGAHTHPIDHDHPSFSTVGASGKLLVLTGGATGVQTYADGVHPFGTQDITIDVPALTATSGVPSAGNTDNAGSTTAFNVVQPTGIAYLWIAMRPA